MITSVSTTLKDSRKVTDWKAICMAVRCADKNERVAVMHDIAEKTGNSFGSIKRHYYAFVKPVEEGGGESTLVDGRRTRRFHKKNSWLATFRYFCENDRNTSKNAYRRMMDIFRSGAIVPILNRTWRQIWAEENPGEAAPAQCPELWEWTPRGATYSNLMMAVNRESDWQFSIVASRRGMSAARDFVRTVLTTRRGLHVGEMFEFDDVWHNVDVRMSTFGDRERVVQPLEFAGYDIASGYKAMSCMKPRYVRDDGKRDNLKEFQFRCALAQLLIKTGFYRGGVKLVVEHGTTAIREKVEKQIRGIPAFGDLFTFERSGILGEQVHAGLFAGCGGGNFRMKAFCEGGHNVLHNREAWLPGNRGRDAEHLHESQAALVKYEDKIAAIAATLPDEFRAHLAFNTLTFAEYAAAFQTIEAALMDDPWHRLEGWGERVVREFRLSVNDAWQPLDRMLMDGDPKRAEAVATIVRGDRRLTRMRPMSRREAWVAGQKELTRVDDFYMPHFLDVEKDAKVLTVRGDGRFGFKDELYYGRDEVLYRAIVKGREGWAEPMGPGKKLVVCFNPFIPEKVWVLDGGDGHILGTCAIDERAPRNDRRAIEAAMGEQAHDLAEKVNPVRGRHLDDAINRAAMMANNERVIRAAREAAQSAPTVDGVEAADVLALTEIESTGRGGPVATDDFGEEESFLERMNRANKGE